MATTNMSIRVDTELKARAEEILSKLGMTMNGGITMFLNQIVRDQAVPLSLSLSSEQSLTADLLRARTAREQGVVGTDAFDALRRMEQTVEEAERRGEL